MKSVIFLIFSLASIIRAYDEKCAIDYCNPEYTTCQRDVFGCASEYQNCKNKCGETEPCFQECAYYGKTKDLYFCWQLNCSGVVKMFQECHIEQCANIYKTECLSTQNNKLECFNKFQHSHPECYCIYE